jgi:type IV pilus assembly protein PilV
MMRQLLPRAAQQGGSLIEVMVAALLLAVGLLSMAAMQASALQLGKDAEYRAIASEIAFSMGEMVKANVGGAASYVNQGNAFVSPAPEVAVLTNCDALNVTCTNVQMAAQDMSRVRALARNRLPDGQVVAQFIPGAGNTPSVIDLWIAWLPADTRTGEAKVDNQIANGCPAGFDTRNMGVRCHYFRIAP